MSVQRLVYQTCSEHTEVGILDLHVAYRVSVLDLQLAYRGSRVRPSSSVQRLLYLTFSERKEVIVSDPQ